MSFKIIICFFLAISTVTYGKISKIIGGMDANIADFPYSASLRRISTGQHLCSGAILSNFYILTAAHCVYENYIPRSDLVVFVGTEFLNFGYGTPLQVQDVIVHHAFTGQPDIANMNLNDIALVKVLQFTFNEFRKKVALPTTDIINSETAIFTGWGTKSYPSDVTSNTLQKALMRIITPNICDSYLSFKTNPDQFCAFNRPGIGICVGDSGGPLVHNGILVGIASISIPCATGVPDLFSNVYSHMPFIMHYLNT